MDGLRLNREEARRQRQALDGTIDAQNAILSKVADARGRLGETLTEIQNRLEGDLAILPDSQHLSLVSAADKAVKDAQGAPPIPVLCGKPVTPSSAEISAARESCPHPQALWDCRSPY